MTPLRSALARALPLFALSSLVAATGCATNEQMMPASGRTPAAEGTVSTEHGENDNIVAHVRVKHLAPPSRLASDANTYVVWVQPPNAPIQSVGALRLDDELEGELDFVTPHEQFRLTITPESSATFTAPMNRPVFSVSVDAR